MPWLRYSGQWCADAPFPRHSRPRKWLSSGVACELASGGLVSTDRSPCKACPSMFLVHPFAARHRRPGPATASHTRPSWTLSALPQLIPNLPMATETRPENQNTGVFARSRCEPAYPCTVSGGGACLAGVTVAVAISAQIALPHSSHKHLYNRRICMSTGMSSLLLHALSCGIPVAALRDITELHLHEPASTSGYNFSVGHRHPGVTHHGSRS